MTWEVDGDSIMLAASKTPDPTPDPGSEQEWADICAAAVNAAITTRLNGVTVTSPSDAEDELTRTAVLDGLEMFRSKDARFGVLSVGPDGSPVRVAVDLLWSVPVIARYATPGMG